MKNILIILFFIPLVPSAQESISYTSPLSEYIIDTHQFEEIERIITVKDNIITILSKGMEATDIQTWKVIEKVEQGSDYLFKCTSADNQYPTLIKVFNYTDKVERIEVYQPSDNIPLVRFHIDKNTISEALKDSL